MKSKISITLDERLLKNLDSYIDGFNVRNRSQAIEQILSKNLSQTKIAVILASKMKDYRFNKEIKGEKAIVQIFKKLQNHSFKKAFIIGEKEVLSKIFEVIGSGNDYFLIIEYIEDSVPKGSLKSLSLIKNKINSSFLIIPADNYFEFDIDSFWKFHSKNNNLVTLAITTSNNPSKLGVVELTGEKIIGFAQKPDKSKNYLVWSGIMMCEPEILFYDYKSIENELILKLIELNSAGGFIFAGEWKNLE
ncbi:MAG: sugar phosphate nucleotidyltransferase [Candidatus Nanoarchaeia archaeon]|nr:sugar phosphate nucleotidyltransferase [Candidatus Nanoarchaeia archaeon]